MLSWGTVSSTASYQVCYKPQAASAWSTVSTAGNRWFTFNGTASAGYDFQARASEPASGDDPIRYSEWTSSLRVTAPRVSQTLDAPGKDIANNPRAWHARDVSYRVWTTWGAVSGAYKYRTAWEVRTGNGAPVWLDERVQSGKYRYKTFAANQRVRLRVRAENDGERSAYAYTPYIVPRVIQP